MRWSDQLVYSFQKYYAKFNPDFAEIEANIKVSPLTLIEKLEILERSNDIKNKGIMLYAYLFNRMENPQLSQEYLSKVLNYIDDEMPGYDGYRVAIMAATCNDKDLFINALEKLKDEHKLLLLGEMLTSLDRDTAVTFLNLYQDEFGIISTQNMVELSNDALKNLLIVAMSEGNNYPDIIQSLPFALRNKDIRLAPSEAQEIYQQIDFSNMDNLPLIGVLSSNFASVRAFEGELEAQIMDMIAENPSKAQDIFIRIQEYFPQNYRDMLSEKIVEGNYLTTEEILNIYGISVKDILNGDSKLQHAENFLRIYNENLTEPLCKAALEKFYKTKIYIQPKEEDKEIVNKVQSISDKVLTYMLNRDKELLEEPVKVKKTNKFKQRDTLYNPDAVLMLDLKHLNSMYKVYNQVEEQSQKHFPLGKHSFSEFIDITFAKIKLFFERFEVNNEVKKTSVEALDAFFLVQTEDKVQNQSLETKKSPHQSILEKGIERSKKTAAHRIEKYLKNEGFER